MDIKWRKGHLRDENSASKCKWREYRTMVPFRDRIMGKSDIEIPGQENQKVVREVAGDPAIIVYCLSPDILAEPQNELRGKVHGAERIDKVVTNLEACRACPFWTLK